MNRSCVALAMIIASHVLAGAFSRCAKGALAGFGIFFGMMLIYAVGAAGIAAVAIFSKSLRKNSVQAFRFLWEQGPPYRWLAVMACYIISATAFYYGLNYSVRVADFAYLTRLDWVLQIPLCLWLLGERVPRMAWAGVATAVLGGLLIGQTGQLGTGAIVGACTFVAGSVAAHTLLKPMLDQGRLSPDAVLAVRTVIITVLFGGLVLCTPAESAPGQASWFVALLPGLVLLGLFWTRFRAMAAAPLWVYAAFAPIQPLVVTLISWQVDNQLPSLLVGIGCGLVCIGEVLIAFAHNQPSSAAEQRVPIPAPLTQSEVV